MLSPDGSWAKAADGRRIFVPAPHLDNDALWLLVSEIAERAMSPAPQNRAFPAHPAPATASAVPIPARASGRGHFGSAIARSPIPPIRPSAPGLRPPLSGCTAEVFSYDFKQSLARWSAAGQPRSGRVRVATAPALVLATALRKRLTATATLP